MKATIAIADDHHLMRNSIAELLSSFSYPVVIKAKNGFDLIDQLNKAAVLPDVCLMDVNMPGMDGIEATRKLKEQWPAIGVIGFSMNDDKATKLNMKRAGAKAYLLKETDIRDICACIDKVAAIKNITKSASVF